MTMTLEELRESLDVGCLPNTDRPRWFAAIDSAIRERDELRAQRDSAREMHAKRDDEAQFWRASAERAEAELAALKARIAKAPITQVSRMAAIGGGGYEWAGCMVPDGWNGKRVRLVVEE